MSGFDYIHCNECYKKLIYDGDCTVRDYLCRETITCNDCVEKLKKKIESLESIINEGKENDTTGN